MTAAPFTPEQERKLAEFDAAPQLAESAPMTRAMLALAEELAASPGLTGRRALADRIRATVAAVLAADPEPRDAVIERMARAMWAQVDGYMAGVPWDRAGLLRQEKYRLLAAAALDASPGGTQ